MHDCPSTCRFHWDLSLLHAVCNLAQAARLAGEQVEQAVKGAEEGFKEGNTLEATAKAAIAAWRASQVGLSSCTPRPCPLR